LDRSPANRSFKAPDNRVTKYLKALGPISVWVVVPKCPRKDSNLCGFPREMRGFLNHAAANPATTGVALAPRRPRPSPPIPSWRCWSRHGPTSPRRSGQGSWRWWRRRCPHPHAPSTADNAPHGPERPYRLTPAGLASLRASARRARPCKRSTGPRTPDGKARSRLNATKHGERSPKRWRGGGNWPESLRCCGVGVGG
jgi:hypothetical protein